MRLTRHTALFLVATGVAAVLGSERDTETQLQEAFTRLTDTTVYDRNVRPFPVEDQPVDVYTRMYVYFLSNIDAQSSEFFVQLLVRQRWNDPRLKYNVSNRCLHGEEWHKTRMWVPTTYLVNQKDAQIIDVSTTNTFVSVCPDGGVHFSFRVKTTLFCDMYLKKFPFDNQVCQVLLESWLHTTQDLVMTWESDTPISSNPIALAEYELTSYRVSNSSFHFPKSSTFNEVQWRTERDVATYSRLILNFYMSREPGYYLLDYYIPSGLLVIVSWVSFWLSPEAAPARVTLGTSTMLTFITLSNSIKNSLPKVSYTKFVDIWLFICTTFIFLSLVEFAFVNTIHRRRKNVALKKVTTKHVLKSTLSPSASRNNLSKYGPAAHPRLSSSCSTLDKLGHTNMAMSQGSLLVPPSPKSPNTPSVFFVGVEEDISESGQAGTNENSNYLTVRSLDSYIGPDNANSTVTSESELGQTLGPQARSLGQEPIQQRRASVFPRPFIEMTPPQIAKWIDIRSRWLFPLCFLGTNIVYWIFIAF
ncbi:pH-sensitive chloride channel 2-like [Pollicipes pollicipes]|uniref:pH-sensitive chloride channel 2-like n=1 Tax=Pollicipes pollicipes TaxID=41117 RepID=UPI001884C67F|nr:pH-sensitive chloride channel 2-like [Pollicipes pollicipes]